MRSSLSASPHAAAFDADRDRDTGVDLGARHRGLGRYREDLPAMVCGRLGLGEAAAADRIAAAVSMATRSPRLLGEMAAGRLDEFRARTMDSETAPLDAEQAATAVDHVIDRMDARHGRDRLPLMTAGELRRLTRREVAKVAPRSIEQAATQARQGRRVSRWAAAPGVDMWGAVLPCEGSRIAYAAVTERARLLQLEARERGTRLTMDQARADALVELITAQAQVSSVVHVATPAEAVPAHAMPPQATPAHATPAAVAQGADGVPDLPAPAPVTTTGLTEVSMGGNVGGMREPSLVPSEWVGALLARPATITRELTCDPATGALVTSDAGRAAYVPSEAQRRQVRLRDGHCRFPGCMVAARLCDLDHVVPWQRGPDGGPTRVDNLMLLCRRHHQVKQRPGWSVHLHPDGTVHWTDPRLVTHTTWPVDHLALLHVPAAPMPGPASGGVKVAEDELAYFSWLEHHLEQVALCWERDHPHPTPVIECAAPPAPPDDPPF